MLNPFFIKLGVKSHGDAFGPLKVHWFLSLSDCRRGEENLVSGRMYEACLNRQQALIWVSRTILERVVAADALTSFGHLDRFSEPRTVSTTATNAGHF